MALEHMELTYLSLTITTIYKFSMNFIGFLFIYHIPKT